MKWWKRMWRRPNTDAGKLARRHLARVRAQQAEVDDLLTRTDTRVDANHFREAFQRALSPRKERDR